MKMLKILIASAIVEIGSIASADPIAEDEVYALGNHPNGGAAAPYFGLRLDGVLAGKGGHTCTFDSEAAGEYMQMLWDSAPLMIHIWGTAYGGQDIGTTYAAGTTALWTIDFPYSGVADCGSGICSNTGSGTVISTAFGSLDMTPMGAAAHGYTFQVNNEHRGVAGPSGWGWVNHCPSAGNGNAGGDCGRHLYSSDWLFTAHAVPEPGTLALFGIGLVRMGIARRRKAA